MPPQDRLPYHTAVGRLANKPDQKVVARSRAVAAPTHRHRLKAFAREGNSLQRFERTFPDESQGVQSEPG